MTESSNVNKSLENQIENMIDGIIGEDNEESSLHLVKKRRRQQKIFRISNSKEFLKNIQL